MIDTQEKLASSLSRVSLTSVSEPTRHLGRHDDRDSLPELPQEIVEHIIDEVSPSPDPNIVWDKETLENCTLVCRAWLPRSSHQLFKCLSVSPLGILRLLDRAQTSARLQTYVRGVHIGHGTSVAVQPADWIPLLFATFSRLKHLGLRYGVPASPEEPFAMLHPRLHTLNTLHLRDVAVSNLPVCLGFFGNIGELVLDNVSGDAVPVAQLPYLLVGEIRLERSYPNCLGMLKAIVTPFMLTTLSIRMDWPQAEGMVDALNDFLGAAGESIEHLSLIIGWDAKPTGRLDSLSNCYSLRTIDLEFSEPEIAQYLMTEVLRFIPSGTRRIRLHCSPDWFEDLYELDWSLLEERLDRCNGATLEFCEICKFEDQQQVHERIKGKLATRFHNVFRVQAWDLF